MYPSSSLPFDLIASDYDLTLATFPGGVIGTRTLDRIRQVRELGVHLAVISGRSTGGLTNRLRRHDLDFDGLYIVGYNGAEISQAWDGEVIASYTLPKETLLQVMKELEGGPVEGIVPHGQNVYSVDPDTELARVESSDNSTRMKNLRSWEELDVAAHKVLLGGRVEDLQDTVDHLRGTLGDAVEVVFSAPHLVEVNAKGISKGLALGTLAGHLGVDQGRTLTFGDNENDIALIEAAGVGVAMGNAIDSLKVVADRITASVHEDGVADVLEEYFPQI